MRIMGLDPGLNHMGWGMIDMVGTRLSHVGHGVISTTTADELGVRLMRLYSEVARIIAEYQPDAFSIEQAFVYKDPVAEADARAALINLGYGEGDAAEAVARAAIALGEGAKVGDIIREALKGMGR